MKRIVAMLLTMMMLFGIVGFATADTDSTLPEDIVKQLDKNDVVLSSVQLGTSDGVCWFIIVRTWENKNVLYMFKQFNGSVFYRLLAKNEKILPDSTSLSLTLRNTETDPWVGDEFVGPVLDIDIINNTGDTTFRLVFQMNGAEDWNLIRMWDVANQYMSAEFDATRIYQFYDYRSKNVKRSAEWRYPRNLKDAVLSDLLKYYWSAVSVSSFLTHSEHSVLFRPPLRSPAPVQPQSGFLTELSGLSGLSCFLLPPLRFRMRLLLYCLCRQLNPVCCCLIWSSRRAVLRQGQVIMPMPDIF